MGKFSAYKLPLKSLPVGSQEFDYHLDKQFFVDMESSDIHGADLDVHVTVVNKGDIYDMTIDIAGEITLVCDRCLDDLEWPVDTSYHIFVKYGLTSTTTPTSCSKSPKATPISTSPT